MEVRVCMCDVNSGQYELSMISISGVTDETPLCVRLLPAGIRIQELINELYRTAGQRRGNGNL